MQILKPARFAGAVITLASLPLIASAQTQAPPATTSPSSPPAATQPAPAPTPAVRPDKSVTAPKADPLIGLAVFSSDGSRLGTVQEVNAEPGGKVMAIHIKTGGFLGFGGKMVAIPEGKFTRAGDNVQLGITAEEVSKLPEIKKES
jgi:sporulation protein YlmC with PRC-barrel domain